ncbi:MAG: class I SAM-dependent methyltransferase [Azonexus sp.]|nr:class I SAM-dependent methyltransferase [Betaproteobacteria bacterium]MBK8917377.1 class I SAM-dependent methyltransferase [Betaproteobacteria bacterium]MBP6035139.1 class I SAM-dependent methyltransferase [Azonexus sp.]MBP6905883.1 class I SAM-dependent methyltransferase [Azonexus sp.]
MAAAWVEWDEGGTQHRARWRSAAGHPAPRRIVVADDSLRADEAYALVSQGTALLWRGDFHNARQLLQALARRMDRRRPKAGATLSETFHLHRQAQAQRSRTLGLLLLPLDGAYSVPLRRAPELRAACEEVLGAADGEAGLISLRELQGLVGAHEWRKKGVPVPALGGRIHPWYGVFSPVRGEYLDLVGEAPLPATRLAFDIGTGTGVLAALLAWRGVERVVATDCAASALACARENVERLGLAGQVDVVEADLFPPGRAPLVVCNPPWVPGKPATAIEAAIYDPESRMLKGFLAGVAAHLEPGGEAWLILSDLAEHLGLRQREDVLAAITAGGLAVIGRLDIRPRHGKAADPDDPLHAARSRETTSLWRLVARG